MSHDEYSNHPFLFQLQRRNICQNTEIVTVHFVHSNTLRDAQKLHFMQFRT